MLRIEGLGDTAGEGLADGDLMISIVSVRVGNQHPIISILRHPSSKGRVGSACFALLRHSRARGNDGTGDHSLRSQLFVSTSSTNTPSFASFPILRILVQSHPR